VEGLVLDCCYDGRVMFHGNLDFDDAVHLNKYRGRNLFGAVDPFAVVAE
jgi:hypothetical protein